MKNKELLNKLKGGLIVSCQVQPDDPVYSMDFVLKMAQAFFYYSSIEDGF